MRLIDTEVVTRWMERNGEYIDPEFFCKYGELKG